MEVRSAGTVVLMGSDGNTIVHHEGALTHCHLPNIDPTIDVSRARVPKHLPCQICNYTDKGHTMLLCDACGNGWHMGCMHPPIVQVPTGDWFCPRCSPLVAPPGMELPQLPLPASPGTSPEPSSSTINLDGRVYMRAVTSGKGIATARYAIVRLIDAPSRSVELHFTTGKIERTTVRAAARYIMPVGFQIPTAESAPAQVLLSAVTPRLPDMWDLTAERTARVALSTLMPGHWPVGHVHAIMAQGETFRESPAPSHPDRLVQLDRLLEVVDFTLLTSVVDSWPTDATLMSTLQQRRPHLQAAPLVSAPWKALHPGPYLEAQATNQLPAIVAAPSSHVTDLLLCLAAMHVDIVACILAPITFLQTAPTARRSWLQQLTASNRLRIVLGAPVVAGAVQCVWLCVFKSAQLQAALCVPGTAAPTPS